MHLLKNHGIDFRSKVPIRKYKFGPIICKSQGTVGKYLKYVLWNKLRYGNPNNIQIKKKEYFYREMHVFKSYCRF